MNAVADILKRSSLFADVTDAEMTVIEPRFSRRSVKAGDVLFDDGSDDVSGMFVIADGNIKIYKRVAGDDDRQQAVAVLTPGSFFGEMALLDEEVRSAGAMALTEASLLFLSKESFLDLIDQNLELGHKLLMRLSRTLTKRLRDTNNLFREVVSWGYRARKEVKDLKSNFLSTISHELRTPIHSIQGFSSLMKDTGETDPELQKKFVEVILHESKRLGDLINDLISLAEMEYGAVVLQRKEVSLTEIVTKAFEEYQIPAKEKRLAYTLMASPTASVVVDTERLSQAISHLIENAIKFTSYDGRVEVSVDENAEAFIVEVADSGRGIATRNLERIFDKFYQVDQSSTRDVEGAGIGLSLAKHLVGLHGGRIDVKSREHEGSTFTIVLPKQHVTQHG
jgi:signal transduction histidine kinase